MDTLDDASRHRAQICAAVSAYFRLIVQTAERDADVLAFQSLGNRASERCLTNSRRAVKADDWRFEVAAQFQNSQVLYYSLLNLLHAVVVFVEHLLGILQVGVVLGECLPRQTQNRLEVGVLYVVVGRLWIEAFELACLALYNLANLVVELLFCYFLSEFLKLYVLRVSQFV